MKIYKIRHRVTGLFSRGGGDVSRNGIGRHWSKKGKIWPGLGPLRNHLNGYLGEKGGFPMDWEVITYELVETELDIKSAYEMLNPNKIIDVLKK